MPSSGAADPPISPSLAWLRLSQTDDWWVELPAPPGTVVGEQPPPGHSHPVARPGKINKHTPPPSPQTHRRKTDNAHSRQQSNPSCESTERKTPASPAVSSASGKSSPSSEKGFPTSSVPRKKYRSSTSPDRQRTDAQSTSTALTSQTGDAAKERNVLAATDTGTECTTTICPQCARKLPRISYQQNDDVQVSPKVSRKRKARLAHSRTTEAKEVCAVCPECSRSSASHQYSECVGIPQSSKGSRPLKTQEFSVEAKNCSLEMDELPHLQQNCSEYTTESQSEKSRSNSPPTLCNQCRKQLSSHAAEFADRNAAEKYLQSSEAVNNVRGDSDRTPQKSLCTPFQKKASAESKVPNAPHMTREMIYDLLSTPYEPLCMAYYSNTSRERPTGTDTLVQEQTGNTTAYDFLTKRLESDLDSQTQSTRSLEDTQEDGHSDHRSWPSDIGYFPHTLVAGDGLEQPLTSGRYCMPKATNRAPVTQPHKQHILSKQPHRRNFVQLSDVAKTNICFLPATSNANSSTSDGLDIQHEPIRTIPPKRKITFSQKLFMEKRAYDSIGSSATEALDDEILSTDRSGFFPPAAGSLTHHTSRSTFGLYSEPSSTPVGKQWGHPTSRQVDGSATPVLHIPPTMVVAEPSIKLSTSVPRYATPPAEIWLQLSSSCPSDSSDLSSLLDQMWNHPQFDVPM